MVGFPGEPGLAVSLISFYIPRLHLGQVQILRILLDTNPSSLSRISPLSCSINIRRHAAFSHCEQICA